MDDLGVPLFSETSIYENPLENIQKYTNIPINKYMEREMNKLSSWFKNWNGSHPFQVLQKRLWLETRFVKKPVTPIIKLEHLGWVAHVPTEMVLQ